MKQDNEKKNTSIIEFTNGRLCGGTKRNNIHIYKERSINPKTTINKCKEASTIKKKKEKRNHFQEDAQSLVRRLKMHFSSQFDFIENVRHSKSKLFLSSLVDCLEFRKNTSKK